MPATPRLAERLRQLRTSLGLTLQDIAELCGMRGGRAVVSKWERADNPQRPDDETLLLLADFYGVSLDYLFGRPEAPIDSPAVAAALRRLQDRIPSPPLPGRTPAERVAGVWRLLGEIAPGVFHRQRVAAQLNLSSAQFDELIAGRSEPDPAVIVRFSALVHMPDRYFQPALEK